MTIKIKLLLVLLLVSGATYSQTLNPVADTLLWKAETLTDLTTDTVRSNSSEFVTYGVNKIKWTQFAAEAPAVFNFTVTAIDDHWNSDGYLVYTTMRKNKTQSFRFERVGTLIKVYLSYPVQNETKSLVFNIDEVSPLQE